MRPGFCLDDSELKQFNRSLVRSTGSVCKGEPDSQNPQGESGLRYARTLTQVAAPVKRRRGSAGVSPVR